jgi:mono/diheme cytochrome c family protein
MSRLHLATFAVFLGAMLVGIEHAVADSAAVERGKAVVEQWCRTCHLRAANPLNPDGAPPFEAITMRPGRNDAYLTRFMAQDHFPMTTFRLFDHEKRDVIAYIVSLKTAK